MALEHTYAHVIKKDRIGFWDLQVDRYIGEIILARYENGPARKTLSITCSVDMNRNASAHFSIETRVMKEGGFNSVSFGKNNLDEAIEAYNNISL